MSTFYVDFFQDLSFENEKKEKDDDEKDFQINLLFIHLNIRIATIKFRLGRHWYHVVFKNWNCNLRDLIFL